MTNQVFFVKYAGNQPGKIETHYAGENERLKPLLVVADMLAVFFPNVSLPNFTVHTNVESDALAPNLLLSNLKAGRTAKTALIIKSSKELSTNTGVHADEVAAKAELDELQAMISKYLQKDETVQISRLKIEIIERAGFVCEAIALDSVDTLDFELPAVFDWPLPDNESDPINKDAYFTYLKRFLEDIQSVQVKKSIESPYLSTIVGAFSQHLTGNADLYIVPSACRLINRNQIAMVLKLNSQPFVPEDLVEAIGYTLASNSLFDISGRPPPVGILTDFRNQWILIWIGPGGVIRYAETEVDTSGETKELTRQTALHHIRMHVKAYDALLKAERVTKRKAEAVQLVFDGLEAGFMKKQRVEVAEDNMVDLLDTEEEVHMYEISKRMKQTPLFDK
ncbi:hypothetical protein HDU79_006224 [Rhizoclosmatium sp. JEL0117]|nr:hypothetical protein HDU79_006224 [Rhizoclosmatium sp. JEL0117]